MKAKFLVVVGCQESKLSTLDKKKRMSILDFIEANSHNYEGVISVIRTTGKGDTNFRRSGDTIANTAVEYLPYESHETLEVPGYTIDCRTFRKDAHYDIIGVSTAASVLATAMTMYSNGLEINVLEKYCADRKGSALHESALSIMNAYMPGVVK